MFDFIQLHPLPGVELAICYLCSGSLIYVTTFRVDGTVTCEVF